MRPLTLPLLLSALLPGALAAQTLLSTDFTGLTASSNRALNFTWNVADPAAVDLVGATFDSFAFASGSLYGFDGANAASGLRDPGDLAQFNSTTLGQTTQTAPLNVARFSFLFEVKTDILADISGVSFNFGTAQTSGSVYTTNLTGTMDYTVRLTNGVTTHTFGGSVASPADSMPFLTAMPTSAITLGAGIWRLDIDHTKPGSGNLSQRTSLDNLALLGTATPVPEPAAYACGIGALVLLATLGRRRPRA